MFVFFALTPKNIFLYYRTLLVCCTCCFCCLVGPVIGDACFSMSPPWSCMSNNVSLCPSVPPPRQLSASLCSTTPICTFPIHVRALALSSLAHILLCLCSCLFLFLCVCCAHCVCAYACVCTCWCVRACVLCLLMCTRLPCVFKYVLTHVFRVCVCVNACLYFAKNTCISEIFLYHACLN